MNQTIVMKNENIDISNMENGTKLPEVRLTIDRNNEKSEKRCLYCCSFFLFLFSIGIIGCVITYYVFAIMSLVEDYHFVKECPNIHIWQYVLTTLIIYFLFSPKRKIEEENKMIQYIIQLILNIGICIWGLIELTKDIHCDSIKKSLLWTITIITVVANLINILSYIIMIIIRILSE
jgi:hypothetical protein